MAYKGAVRNSVAVIVIFGHLLIFLLALALGIASILRGIDAIQTILMASPILAVVSFAAFTYIIDSQGNSLDISEVSALYAVLCITFPVILIIVIVILFYLFYLQIDQFGPDQLKISLGAVETFFGVFLGAISKALFGSNRPS